MKKYILWFDVTKNPPDSFGCFDLDQIKGFVINANDEDHAKAIAINIEKQLLSGCNKKYKCGILFSIQEIIN